MTVKEETKTESESLKDRLLEIKSNTDAIAAFAIADGNSAVPLLTLLEVLSQQVTFNITVAAALKAIAAGSDVSKSVDSVIDELRPTFNAKMKLDLEIFERALERLEVRDDKPAGGA